MFLELDPDPTVLIGLSATGLATFLRFSCLASKSTAIYNAERTYIFDGSLGCFRVLFAPLPIIIQSK